MKGISDFLLSKTKHRPTIGIVCGSGLGGLVDGLEQQESFLYENIPGFPASTGRVIKFNNCSLVMSRLADDPNVI